MRGNERRFAARLVGLSRNLAGRRPLASAYGEGDDGTKAKGRSGALIGPSQESAPAVVRFSALHPRVRNLQPRLSADERRARVHAAAGPARDRGLYAASLA